jgi:hypothetical protein
VRVACRLLCQLFYHVQRVQHQLCHVDGARTTLPGRLSAVEQPPRFTYLPDFLDQVFSRCD